MHLRSRALCGDEPCWATQPHKLGAKADVGLDSHLRYYGPEPVSTGMQKTEMHAGVGQFSIQTDQNTNANDNIAGAQFQAAA